VNTQRNVAHPFVLTGMKAGDWFMGCPHCGERLPTNSAGPNRCARCGLGMLIYTVKPEDVKISARKF
jgi:hypothetical protein